MSAVEVRMPRLSESMAEGTVVRWLHEPGAVVRRGEELAEIETDKATVSFEADADGQLEIVAGEGATLAVGELIGRLLPLGAPTPSPNGAAVAPSPGVQESHVHAPTGQEPGAPEPGAPEPGAPEPGARPRVSPLARRRARELGVDPATVHGTGPLGRVVRADIEAAAPSRQPAAPRWQESHHADTGRQHGGLPATARAGTVAARTAVQRATARRLAPAGSVPTFTLTADVDLTGVHDLRARLAEVPGAPVPGITDLLVAASARALREHPRVNAAWRDGEVVEHGGVHVGIAVDTPDGLLVPTVTDADRRGIPGIGDAVRDLAERARAGRCTPAELDGATFTVSNLGPFGIREFTAVPNPPQAAILAAGAARDTPVVEDGAVVVRPLLTATLTCDHRVLDGAAAARFLGRLAELLEHPLALLLNPEEER